MQGALTKKKEGINSMTNSAVDIDATVIKLITAKQIDTALLIYSRG